MSVTIEAGPLAVTLAELKTYLRITRSDEDDHLESLLRAATATAERQIGQLIMQRSVTETLNATQTWQRLTEFPVASIDVVRGLPADGPSFILPVDAFAIDINGQGMGLIRIDRPGAAGRVQVDYQAGFATEPAQVPAPIGHGIIRLAGEYHARREGLEAQLPASVDALWRPWRRVRLA